MSKMPGNGAYERLLDFIMPSWDSPEIDIEQPRTIGLLGFMGTGKTTLAITIANDLRRKYNDLVVAYGYWLHQIVERLDGIDTKHVLIVIEDATSRYPLREARKKLDKDMAVYWELRHRFREAGLREYTGKIGVIVIMHSYMVMSKYIRNAWAMVIKSIMPRWQRFEHEDITLKWIDSAIVKELSKMRLSSDPETIHKALNKALVVYMDGASDIISYNAVKDWPKNTIVVDDDDAVQEDNDVKDKELVNAAKILGRYFKKLRDEKKLIYADLSAYIKLDGRKVRIGNKHAVEKIIELSSK